MTKTSKRELLQAIRPRYLRASKADKGRILDKFVATTGYHRKYAIRLLNHGAPRGPPAAVVAAASIPTPWPGPWPKSGRSAAAFVRGDSIPSCLAFWRLWNNTKS